MRYLIDGYNLMYAQGLMPARRSSDGFRKARERFLRRLAEALGPIDAHLTTVVFDAAKPPADQPSSHRFLGLSVLFAVSTETADERIEELLAVHSAPKNLTLVSSDLRVRRAGEKRKARVRSTEEFLDDLDDRMAKKAGREAEERSRRRGVTDPAEAAHWQETFAHLDNDPETRQADREFRAPWTDEELARIAREVEAEDRARRGRSDH